MVGDIGEERRLRQYLVDVSSLYTLLNLRSLPTFVTVHSGESIPDDVRIVGVDYSSSRRAVVLLIEHESFEPVPYGQVPPIMSDFVKFWSWACKLVQIDGKFYYEVPDGLKLPATPYTGESVEVKGVIHA